MGFFEAEELAHSRSCSWPSTCVWPSVSSTRDELASLVSRKVSPVLAVRRELGRVSTAAVHETTRVNFGSRRLHEMRAEMREIRQTRCPDELSRTCPLFSGRSLRQRAVKFHDTRHRRETDIPPLPFWTPRTLTPVSYERRLCLIQFENFVFAR